MGLTLVEKIATRYAVGLKPDQAARSGQIIRIRPKHVMTHDNTAAVIPKFKSIFETGEEGGAGVSPAITHPHQPVFAIDHDIQNKTPENLGKYAKIEAFAREHGVDFYPAGTGISHQVMVEQGYAIPGALIVGSDSHSNLYGGVGALGTPVVRTDAACIWATGQTWWRVPPVARCVLSGRLKPGVVGKDVIIALCGLFNNDEVLNHAVEFVGEGARALSMDQRLSIANMTTEWGALAGVFPFDETLRDYLCARADYFGEGRRPGERREGSLGGYTREDVDRWWESAGGTASQTVSPDDRRTDSKSVPPRDTGQGPVPLHGARLDSDPDAEYAIELELDLSTVIPHVSGPNEVKTMHSLPEMEERHVPIQKAYLLSCVNARFEDLAEAADVVRGKRVAEGVEFYVAAASSDVQARAEQSGHWQTLVDAGAIPLPSGCGPCIGLGTGLVEDGEVAISATNRNFKGRMGSRDAEVYLGSPGVVAASAIAGHICAPTRFECTEARISVRPGLGGQSSDEPRHASELPAAHQPTGSGVQAGAGSSLATASPAGRDARPTSSAGSQADIIQGFPESITGRCLLLPKDNMNTDGIYAGKWTYRDDLTPEQMAEVTFENYDPGFNEIYQPGDVIVSGRNFGTGSSREQAATALKLKGVPCVIAASFSETYRRNAFNNGFLCIECPDLIDHLAETLGLGQVVLRTQGAGASTRLPSGATPDPDETVDSPLTLVGPSLDIDFRASMVRVRALAPRPGPHTTEHADRTEPPSVATEPVAQFPFPPLSTVAQELVVAGGAEAMARASLA